MLIKPPASSLAKALITNSASAVDSISQDPVVTPLTARSSPSDSSLLNTTERGLVS